jgi:NitT/TauT family transport system ATP-binding protein
MFAATDERGPSAIARSSNGTKSAEPVNVPLPPLITFERVGKFFQPVPGGRFSHATAALKDLTFEIAEHEIVGLVGPSGCGKSTTLRLISGLIAADEGRVLLRGKEFSGTSVFVGFMLQKDLLLPWKTILENAEIGLKVRGVPLAERRARATALLTRYGLANFLDHRPHQLSGGMRQRVALARTMALDPEIVLLDEPFAAVDFQTKLVLQQDLLEVMQSTGKTVLYITHDIGEAISLCHRILVLTSRPARVKMEFRVDMPASMSVLERRAHPEFNSYFNAIWRELDLDAELTRS